MARTIRIALGTDHGGFILKEKLKKYLLKKGYEVKDFGTFSLNSCDYPLIGHEVSKSVSKGQYNYGILICKTGFGMAIIANKVRGIRSAVCDSVEEATSAREHNDCNVLSLAAKRVNFSNAKKIVDKFLNTKGAEARHKRRVNQIKELEKAK